MTTIISARSAQDFLALVPNLAGFQPVESLVLVVFRGTRTCGVLRVNLPRSNDPDELSAAASALIGMACKISDADAVAPVLYSSEGFGAGRVPRFGELVNAVIFHAEQSGFTVRDALCVAADGWASYFETDTPVGGHPLSLIASSGANATLEADHDGLATARPQHDQNGAPVAASSVNLATRQNVARVIRKFRALSADPAALLSSPEECEALLGLTTLAEEVLLGDPTTVRDRDAGALLFAIQSAEMRDVLLLQWAFGMHAGAAAERANADDWTVDGDRGVDGDACESARRMWGEGPRPDATRVKLAIALLCELVARAPRSCKPPVLSMLAWMNWALGRGSRAGVLIEMAREIDPQYGLADILHRMLAVGRLPEWAFDVPTFEQEKRSAPDDWR